MSAVEKIKLGVIPTPLYRMNGLSAYLDRELYIKRDDMTGVSLGGNKVRKLEYLLADAKRQGADYVLTTGGAQSNHAMLTAACANKLGMKAILVLKKRGVLEKQGNLLLDEILGAEVRFVDSDSYSDVYEQMHRIAAKLNSEGHKAYEIPVGGSVPLGALGYADCVKEISCQSKAMGVKLSTIVCACGSGGMAAGVTYGAKLYMPETLVVGVKVDDDDFEHIVPELVRGEQKLLGHEVNFMDEEAHLIDMTGAGYAIPSKEGSEAIRIMARTEGLILDPVYTGKAFAGMLKLIDEGKIKKDEPALFIHSGGAGGLFAIGLV
ncbi:MAG TPA: D-cysteine desulfhydrase family protein [Eubacteriales bacterium]|nr:D-cysteine desulfhydrase family protein [Clostridia bacterium]HRV72604.1 D-cysteine desulfhydrase family protein [Eubacteriales bacterium]